MSAVWALVLAAVLLSPFPATTMAQDLQQQPPTRIQIQYHESVPAGGDRTAVFLKMFKRVRQDCNIVGKAFARKCAIARINIYTNSTNSSDVYGGTRVNMSASLVLQPDAGGAASPSPAK